MICKSSGTRPTLLAMVMVLALTVSVLFVVSAADAAVTIVTNLNDSGAGSLRNAIETASPGDEIQFSVTGTINLSMGSLDISQDLTITGPAGGLIIDGGYLSRVFVIDNGDVTISNLTITNGAAGTGAGVLVSGPADDALQNDAARDTPPVLPSLTMTGCTISACQASESGGGIHNEGELTMTNCTVSGNNAQNAEAGGIYNNGTLTMLNTTVTGNTVAYDLAFASGVFNIGPAMSVKNSIIAGNGYGEALVADERAEARNRQIAVPNIFNSGTLTSQGYNIAGDDAGSNFTETGDMVNDNPLLGALADNGGPTMTHLPQAGSPAIDAGTNTGAPAADQRGQSRPQDGDGDGTATCDIGSVEIPGQEQPQPPTEPIQTPPAANGQHIKVKFNVAAPVTLTGSDHNGDPLTYRIISYPDYGDLSGTAPNLTYTRQSSLTYNPAKTALVFQVNDGAYDSAPATVILEAFVDPPVSNVPPVANAQIVGTPIDTPVAITLTGSDNDGGALTFFKNSDPANGVLSGTLPNLTYSPNSSFTGADSFTFQVKDPSGLYSASATVQIKVGPYEGEVPIANAGSDQKKLRRTAVVPLDGTGSYDPLGRTLTYSWTITNNEEFSITNADTAKPTVTHTGDDDRVDTNCVLTVTNPDGLSDTDICTLEVPFGSAAASGLLFGLCALAGVRSIRRKNQRSR